jgi:hypothetical protein
MALNVNDMLSRGWKRYYATASGNAVLPANTRIMAILLGCGSTTSSVIVDNAAVAGGTDRIALTGLLAGESPFVTFGINGTLFNVGVSTTLAGTGATVNIFYLDE